MSGAVPQGEDAAYEPATGGVFGKKSFGWAIFEFARNPYYNLVVIYIFAPYFSEAVVAGTLLQNGTFADLAPEAAREAASAKGQSMVALAILIAGLCMAFIAPILGRLSDMGVLRKPPTFAALSLLALTACLLWFIAPGVPGAIPLGIALMSTGYILYTIAELFHNSMLPDAAEPKALPLVSGFGLALGNFAGVGLLVLSLVLLILPAEPAFGLDISQNEQFRIIGPFVGLWLLVFMIPFFLFIPDRRDHTSSWANAFKTLFGRPKEGEEKPESTFQNIKRLFKEHPNVMRFLLGRMLYADAIAAILTLGAVYVVGFLDWSQTEVQIYGITASTIAIVGAFVGGMLDRWIGPKRAIMFELSTLIVLMTFQLSITQDSILFGLIPAGHEVWQSELFPTLSDTVYFAMVVPVGILLVACISSSRYMVTHIAPRDKIGEFYGFYAMAGNVTVWLGPGLVFVMTTLSGDQRIGMSGLGFLFIAGLWIISGVKADKTPEHLKENPTL